MRPDARRIATFTAVTFGFSWIVAAVVHLTGGFSSLGPAALPVALLYMSGPMVGALVCVWLFELGRRREALGLKLPHWRHMG